jgi:hypothetical protein
MNVDVPTSAGIVMGRAPGIVALRADIADIFPKFDLGNVDNLVEYAHLALCVSITHAPTASGLSVEQLVEEATRRRDHLARWAAPLADEGRIDAEALARIRAGSGHADLGQDLIILVSLFRNRWDDLHTLGVVTEEDLDRSTLIGSSLFHMTALRNEAVTLSPSESSLRIRRAWTLLDRAYSECRSAVQYLRRKEGDADDIAPTLRRSGGRTRPEPAPAPDSTAPAVGSGSSPFITP